MILLNDRKIDDYQVSNECAGLARSAIHAGSYRQESKLYCSKPIAWSYQRPSRGNLPEPDAGTQLEQVITESRSLLDLADDWDGNGSPRVSESAWARAMKFLRRYARMAHDSFGRNVESPKIGPGPDGSIDLHWESQDFEILVNVPADPSQMAEFYGDDYGHASIKGRFDPEGSNEGLLLWLMKTDRMNGPVS